MNFNIYIKCCLDEINKIAKPLHKKYLNKIKYGNEYYLTMIYFMLNDVNNWKFLSNLKKCESGYKYHYKTIYNKFRLWTSLKVFENAFYNFKNLKPTNLLLIDATSINNKYGSENIVLNPEYKKKKVTKLSLITNKKGFIYSVVPFKIKNKKKNYSTSVHDVKMINEGLTKIKFIKNDSKYNHLLGDKAYKTNEKFYISNKLIKIITPDKINTKIKNSIYNKKKLKLRVKIENVNCFIKKCERIIMRKDRKINYFMSFVYLASLINNLNCI
jgi:Ni,Fe-hydrogenase maturation factor